MTTCIDAPKGTQMILCVGENGEILKASTAEGRDAEYVTEGLHAIKGLKPVSGFQVIGGTEGAQAMPRKTISSSAEKTEICYWIKLYGNGWVRICV